MAKKTPISMKVDPKEWKQLQAMAEEIGTTASALVREMIHNKVTGKK